jgi:hypothetical protein
VPRSVEIPASTRRTVRPGLLAFNSRPVRLPEWPRRLRAASNWEGSAITPVNGRAIYVFTQNFPEFFKNEMAGTCFDELIDHDPAISHAQDDALSAIEGTVRRFVAWHGAIVGRWVLTVMNYPGNFIALLWAESPRRVPSLEGRDASARRAAYAKLASEPLSIRLWMSALRTPFK